MGTRLSASKSSVRAGLSPLAGRPAPDHVLVDVPRLNKDGIVASLLAAEITAEVGRDPGEIYHQLARELGEPVYGRVEAAANAEERMALQTLSSHQLTRTDLAGEPIRTILTHAPGNGAPIGGLKVAATSGWFAVRPSGTEDIYKIYAESFRGPDHLDRVVEQAQTLVNAVLARGSD